MAFLKPNEGNVDRIIRFVLAVFFFAAAFVFQNWVFAVIGLIPLLTAAIGFCPIYAMFGFRTRARDN